jgi:hypothetical protein
LVILIIHLDNRKIDAGKGISQSEDYSLTIRFPRGQVDMTVKEASAELVRMFPGANFLSLVTVRLHDGARVSVDGFGMPFKNAERPDVEGWINRNEPIVNGTTLLGLLTQSEFNVVIPLKPSAVEFEWNDARLPRRLATRTTRGTSRPPKRPTPSCSRLPRERRCSGRRLGKSALSSRTAGQSRC